MRANRKAKRAARALFRFCVVDGALDEGRVRQVAQRIAASGRRGALPILLDFQRLVRLDCDRHTAVVESAAALAAPLQQQIASDLSRTYGPTLATSFGQNPALIAGIRIKVGSDVYDGSVRGRLAALEDRF
jgi:F-type H+-transporting ATPase subunit delta